jgi:predicted AAA+ superfamily ATPase
MPHLRNRYLLEIIKKKLTFSPVVTIQGARQAGKSFFVKNILKSHYPKFGYVTFDKSSDKDFAETNPDTFLSNHIESKPLAIDEAQKVPRIFDAIKYSVDENKRPGKYILLGSTEFSKLHKIRESLTGRISKARLYPLTVTESLNKPLSTSSEPFHLNKNAHITRPELMRYLSNGGFPGIFSVHSNSERTSLINDWLELTTERDIHQFPGIKLESKICQRILKGIAILDHPDQANITTYCKRDSRIVKRHIEALMTLFVITQLSPYSGGTGKPIYFLCDVALATFLGADFKRQLYTFVVNELLAKQFYKENHAITYFYYRNQKGSIIDLVEEKGKDVSILKIHDEERVTSKNLYLLNAFKEKFKTNKAYLLGPSNQKWDDYGIEVVPWEALG